MKSLSAPAALQVKSTEESLSIYFSGTMTVDNIDHIEQLLKRSHVAKKSIIFNIDKVNELDSASALMILVFMKKFENSGSTVTLQNSNPEFDQLFEMVDRHAHFGASFKRKRESFLSHIGRKTVGNFDMTMNFFQFIGKLAVTKLQYLRHFRSIRFKEILFEMNQSAIKALGIVALTMFLVGIVIAYQSSVQLKIYGANIFIVDMLGISILRELAPMLAAIVVAGRSGSAYAAQIGVMKITEELDAMRTMGFDPYAFLVLPRIIALMIMMPILIFFADITGLLGGMLISNIELGLTPTLFLDRFADVIDVRHFWVGIVKGPFFALLIASIGIFRGLMVENDTQSIGINTTKSVVESIFAVIICDAVFSIVFTNMGV
jgi:phospholipid/cholesterol/gamma-HCH transport system permease protein